MARDLSALLEVDDIHTFYGASRRSRACRSTVDEGEIVTLIGSNGAGKTTTLRSISGLAPPRTGSIRFSGEDISELPAQDIVAWGSPSRPKAGAASRA